MAALVTAAECVRAVGEIRTMEAPWPDFFPNDCPPSKAGPAGGTVFRLVRNNPPTRDDFVPLVLEQPEREFGKRLCQACGVSVYTDIEDVRRLQARVPGHRSKSIAKGELSPDMGLMMPTPTRKESTHTTWWLFEGVDPSPAFEVCAKGRSA